MGRIKKIHEPLDAESLTPLRATKSARSVLCTYVTRHRRTRKKERKKKERKKEKEREREREGASAPVDVG